MNRILANDYVNWTLRTVVGLVLIVAAIDKVADPAAFASSIDNYRLFPEALTLGVATILPWIELMTGLCILFGALRQGAALLAAGLFALFIAVLFTALARGLDIACGCFTQDPDVGMVGWMRILENTGLLVASLLIYRSENSTFSVKEYIERQASRRDTV
jgi:uncharacterized membrane protein YphA (DoxX/SURF4 family)